MKYETRIEELENQVEKLSYTLGTLIGWSARDLGHDNVIKLLDMLPEKREKNQLYPSSHP